MKAGRRQFFGNELPPNSKDESRDCHAFSELCSVNSGVNIISSICVRIPVLKLRGTKFSLRNARTEVSVPLTMPSIRGGPGTARPKRVHETLCCPATAWNLSSIVRGTTAATDQSPQKKNRFHGSHRLYWASSTSEGDRSDVSSESSN